MLGSQKQFENVLDLLDEEKTTNGKVILARVNQIRELKSKIEDLEKQLRIVEDTNNTLRSTLGHF